MKEKTAIIDAEIIYGRKNLKKGFELLKNAKYPSNFNEPLQKVETLNEIWTGKEINKIRNLHKQKDLDSIPICKNCDFTDTYSWVEID